MFRPDDEGPKTPVFGSRTNPWGIGSPLPTWAFHLPCYVRISLTTPAPIGTLPEDILHSFFGPLLARMWGTSLQEQPTQLTTFLNYTLPNNRWKWLLPSLNHSDCVAKRKLFHFLHTPKINIICNSNIWNNIIFNYIILNNIIFNNITK